MNITYIDKMSKQKLKDGYMTGAQNVDNEYLLNTYGSGEKEYTRDQIYYNVSIPHNDLALNPAGGNFFTPAKFLEIRDTPLFNGPPKDWYMSIVRFSIPTSTIPFQIFPTQPAPNTNPNLSVYSVTLSYLGNDFQTFVLYSPQNTYVPVPPAPSASEGAIRTQYVQYYSVYSVQHTLDLINVAFSTAFTNLKTAFPAAPPTAPPFFGFDPATGLFTLYAQTLYAGAGTISIYVNEFLYTNLSPCFNVIIAGVNATNGKNVQFLVENLSTNLVTLPAPQGNCYAMNQEYNTIANWYNFKSIVITSGSLPIRKEWLSTQVINMGISTGSGSNFFPIVTDFELAIETGNELKTYVHYNPTAQYRYIDLQGDTPITVIDLQIYWKDNYDNLYPLLIGPHREASIKFLFEKKSRRKELKE